MSDANMNKSSKTNWARLDALTDDAIDTTDIPALGESFFSRAAMRAPRQRIAITLKLDPDVLAWFRAQGPEWEQYVNAALRLYAEAHKASLTPRPAP
jgi:uncharacterized protein (DUF4415 family)